MPAAPIERLRAKLAARTRSVIDDSIPARRAAVLVPVVGSAGPRLVLFERTLDVADHKGEICFPGGSIEADDVDAVAAALRESQEELGIDPAGVDVLGCLDDVHTASSKYVITPVVGYLETMPALIPDPSEVAKPLVVGLDALSAPGAWTAEAIDIGGVMREFDAHRIGDGLIWGATARILRLFLKVWHDAQS